MSHSNLSTLENSGLNKFLFAEVGTELNGSPLTILSMLARLGKDPWAEAAHWTRLPKTVMMDCLTSSISQMPLPPQAIIDARSTAARLILLLPSQLQLPKNRQDAVVVMTKAMPKWLPIVLLAGLALGAVLSMTRLTSPASTVVPTLAPSVDHSWTPRNWSGSATSPLRKGNVMYFSNFFIAVPVVIIVAFAVIMATVKKSQRTGLVLMIPWIQEMVRVDLRIQVIEIPTQDAISYDNVSMKVDAVRPQRRHTRLVAEGIIVGSVRNPSPCRRLKTTHSIKAWNSVLRIPHVRPSTKSV
jgi:hypothetical protein